jgi:hypothetical protein
VSHASLVAHDGSQMDGFFGVILGRDKCHGNNEATDKFITHLWERLDLSSMTSGTLPGKEAEGAMARRFVLDDRRPTSVVSQGIYLIMKTDLTMAEIEVSKCCCGE